jgi:hypothetical protein
LSSEGVMEEERQQMVEDKAREQLVTRHGRGSAGYEERIAKTQKVKEQLKQYGAYVKSGRIVPRIAPGLTPAVASSTMPDSLRSI